MEFAVPAPKPADSASWIRAIVRGRSFADIGGLWGTLNEKVSVALEAGAADATMIDVTPQGHALWQAFEARMAERGLSARGLTHDATSEAFAASGLRFDVVHCSGVIYHLPSPLLLLEALWRVTGETLILTSMSVPERIETAAGALDLSGGGALFVPGLSGATKRIVAAHFDASGLKVVGINAPTPRWYANGAAQYGPWWWLMTPALLGSMARAVGFEVVDTLPAWGTRATTLICRKP